MFRVMRDINGGGKWVFIIGEKIAVITSFLGQQGGWQKTFSEPNFIQTLETSTPSVLLLVKSSLSRSLAQVTFEECYPLNSWSLKIRADSPPSVSPQSDTGSLWLVFRKTLSCSKFPLLWMSLLHSFYPLILGLILEHKFLWTMLCVKLSQVLSYGLSSPIFSFELSGFFCFSHCLAPGFHQELHKGKQKCCMGKCLGQIRLLKQSTRDWVTMNLRNLFLVVLDDRTLRFWYNMGVLWWGSSTDSETAYSWFIITGHKEKDQMP